MGSGQESLGDVYEERRNDLKYLYSTRSRQNDDCALEAESFDFE